MLSALQQRVAHLVADLPEAERFALAGGAALITSEVIERRTRDLDFFGPTAGAVDALAAATAAALADAGLHVTRELSSAGFTRFTISDGAEQTELDLAADARIRPTERGPYGPRLALEELAADKVLALFARAQPRDFLDVHALAEVYGLPRMCALAAEKDPGFSRSRLAEALATIDRYDIDDFDLDEAAFGQLRDAVGQWQEALVERPPAAPRLDPLGPDLDTSP